MTRDEPIRRQSLAAATPAQQHMPGGHMETGHHNLRSAVGRRLRLLALVALLVPATALALQVGSYRCWSYNVSGGGGSCRLAAPITVNADGTYSESSTSGTYRIDGNRIRFSQSTIRGPGLIAADNQIIFEYDYRSRHHTVTYLCQDCKAAPSTAKRTPAAAAAGALVWAQLRLAFDRPDGYLSWANSAHLVPAEQAAAFAASDAASPPAGSATSSTYLDGKQTVVANFRQATGGRRYVVFLDSGRQRLPVATVHLPASPAEQTISLDASLDFKPAAAPRSQAAPAD